MTDWDLIKTQYEVLGRGVKELCDAHHVTPGILESAIESGGWSVPTTAADADADPNGSMEVSELESLNTEATLLHARHQKTLIPKYIEIEAIFLSRLKAKAGGFEEAGEAKLLADTLAIIKPSVMKQADAKNATKVDGAFDGRIMVVNQFPVPQPGDEHYIAPNAVIVGPEARKGAGGDYTTIEYVPNKKDMN